jgi:hypothetical protein
LGEREVKSFGKENELESDSCIAFAAGFVFF